MIQCLFHLPRFNDYFIEKKYERDGSERNKNVVEIYRALYYDVMQNKELIEISTLPLKKSVCNYWSIQPKSVCSLLTGNNRMLMSS